VLLPGQDLGVDLVEHRDRVPRPFGYLRRGHPATQPRRDASMPQVVRALSQWRGVLLRRERSFRARSHTRAVVDSARSPPVRLRNSRRLAGLFA
jgi:hypothetical protein